MDFFSLTWSVQVLGVKYIETVPRESPASEVILIKNIHYLTSVGDQYIVYCYKIIPYA